MFEVVLLDYGFDGYHGDIPARLHEVVTELKGWCKAHQVVLHLNDITRTILHFERDADFPTGMLVLKYMCFPN